MTEVRSRPRYVPGPRRGDQRRAALLSALDGLLATRSLSQIGIAEITRAAGVTRSAFYFYFPSKAAAVAALLSEFYDEMQHAAAGWYEGGPGTPLERLRTGFAATIALWHERAGLLVAMLDAIGTDPEVREIWSSWIDGFIDRIAVRVSEERAAGLARGSADPRALATVLMGAALIAMERDVRAIVAGEAPSDSLPTALLETFHRAIYETG
ncbi:MAG TPA: TetR/AcrR family transcriptional regulator [Solirubrobacteraceae bacterium]|nr:TetR/AcrR family transcriptional regulator [Solirubrobacteraceae bacterium]